MKIYQLRLFTHKTAQEGSNKIVSSLFNSTSFRFNLLLVYPLRFWEGDINASTVFLYPEHQCNILLRKFKPEVCTSNLLYLISFHSCISLACIPGCGVLRRTKFV